MRRNCTKMNVKKYSVPFEESRFKTYIRLSRGGTRGVMVIVVGNGHGDTSSNRGRD